MDLAEEYKMLFAGPHLILLNRPRGCVGALARANEGVPGGNATSVATVLRGVFGFSLSCGWLTTVTGYWASEMYFVCTNRQCAPLP